MFRDITTLLGERAFRRASTAGPPWTTPKVDKVAGIEARGFILGGAVAHAIGRLRADPQEGKLPHTTMRSPTRSNTVEEMEMHNDAFAPGERMILVDDLIATGGTAEGAVKLLRTSAPKSSRHASSSICRISGARACSH